MKYRIYYTAFFLLSFTLSARCQDKEVTADELFYGFNQTSEGNCVSIAYIKAAIFTYDIKGVFRIDTLRHDSSFVVLHNNMSFWLSLAEKKAAAVSARFQCDTQNIRYKEIWQYALVCYAVMVKTRQQLEKIPSFDTALSVMAAGANSRVAWQYLGLDPKEVEHKPNGSSVNGLGGLVIWRRKHAAFASYGNANLHQGKVSMTFWRRMIYYGRMSLKRL